MNVLYVSVQMFGLEKHMKAIGHQSYADFSLMAARQTMAVSHPMRIQSKMIYVSLIPGDVLHVSVQMSSPEKHMKAMAISPTVMNVMPSPRSGLGTSV